MFSTFLLTMAIGQAEIPKVAPVPEGHLADAIRWAADDILTVPEHLRYRQRYLTIYNWEPRWRLDVWKIITGHLNHLSRNSLIGRVRIVPGTNQSLARFDLRDFLIDPEVYGKLAFVDPYFHIKVKDVKTGEVTTALAPWLATDEKTKAKLAILNNEIQTQLGTAVFRGDWFFNQTAIQADRVPGYYDFLGIKDRATFRKLIGFDEKLAKDFGQTQSEATESLKVTPQPRAIERSNTLGGAYWYSIDFKKAVGNQNPLRIFGEKIEDVGDAHEEYGTLPNGFWATGIFNGQGVRQDSAPDFIASDDSHIFSNSRDKRVHVNMSCTRCHTNGGLKDIDPYVRNLLKDGWTANFFAKFNVIDLDQARKKAFDAFTKADPNQAKEAKIYLDKLTAEYHVALAKAEKESEDFAKAYTKKLEPFLERDRARFEEAVKEATDLDGSGGWDSKIYSRKYGWFWENYEDWRYTSQSAAVDLGTTAEFFEQAIERQLKTTGYIDPGLANFLPGRNRSIPVRQWEEIFPEAMKLLFGISDLNIHHEKR